MWSIGSSSYIGLKAILTEVKFYLGNILIDQYTDAPRPPEEGLKHILF